jgi:hypothetical protein
MIFFKNMINIRPALRKFLEIIFFLISKILIRSTVFCGVRFFTKNLKKSEKLFILSSGSSINQINQKDFKKISSYDSIGLNYFIFHDFVPTSYLIETHDTYRGYFDYVACNSLKFGRTPILYKGYNSPMKIIEFVKNVYFLRKANIQRFYLMKDAYCFDYKTVSGSPGVCSNIKKTKDDYFYNDIASLLYVINLGYLCGYKEVILCGFDMSEDNFYCHTKYADIVSKYPLCGAQGSVKNNIVTNPKTIGKLLSRIQDLGVLFNDRQGGVSQFKCNGVLGEVLIKYEFK